VRRVGQTKVANGVAAVCVRPTSLPPLAEIVQRLLLDVGEDIEEPSAGLTFIIAAIGIAVPPPTPTGRGKELMSILVIHAAQTDFGLRLFEHCIFRAASRAACTAGSSQAQSKCR